jgi:hypothetical protein
MLRFRRANRTVRPQQRARGGGCSGLGAFLFLCLVAAAISAWPWYIDSHGSSAPGVVTDKYETVWVSHGDWFRHFQIVAAYNVPGFPLQRHAACYVDENAYDSLHRGNTILVHYFPNLLNQPFIPATHLPPCSTWSSLNVNPPAVRRVIAVVILLLLILFVWRVMRIRMAGWLLLPWFAWFFGSFVLPHTEPEPEHPVLAKATVDSFVTVRTIGGMNDRHAIALNHPYQIVRLKLIAPGKDTPVIAIDKIDEGSVPNLREGETVDVAYDADNLRIARMQQGTRLFPRQARNLVIIICVVFLILLAILAAVRAVLRAARWSRAF